jgi:hypothetical protein
MITSVFRLWVWGDYFSRITMIYIYIYVNNNNRSMGVL